MLVMTRHEATHYFNVTSHSHLTIVPIRWSSLGIRCISVSAHWTLFIQWFGKEFGIYFFHLLFFFSTENVTWKCCNASFLPSALCHAKVCVFFPSLSDDDDIHNSSTAASQLLDCLYLFFTLWNFYGCFRCQTHSILWFYARLLRIQSWLFGTWLFENKKIIVRWRCLRCMKFSSHTLSFIGLGDILAGMFHSCRNHTVRMFSSWLSAAFKIRIIVIISVLSSICNNQPSPLKATTNWW